MCKELQFIWQALQEGLKTSFKTLITSIIPRMPSVSLFRDSSLTSCGYSIDLCFWWFVPFPDKIVAKTLLHLKNDSEQNLVLINVLEYVTVILNYCGALTACLEYGPIKDPHPVVHCITDDISTKNWTTHTCKKYIIGQALACFFCGLMIGSQVEINAKWISTTANKIANKIS
jgi:hypothetical protein